MHGSPMGSAVSGTLTELALEELEETVLANLDFQPIFYFRIPNKKKITPC